MKKSIIGWVLSAIAFSSPAASDGLPPNGGIIVNEAPNFVRPYVLPKYKGHAIKLTTSQTIRFSITANSSDGAFSLLQHNGKASGWLSARPHTHGVTHEHLYCSRGRCQLWGLKNTTNASHEARVATPGDYGNIPPGSIHTFQLVDPDSQLTHAFHPAGFENLFNVFSQGEHETHGVSSPYVPRTDDPSPFGPMTPKEYNLLVSLDLYAAPEEEYIPRRDFVNGTAGDAKHPWHDGPNTLSDDSTTPYFIAKDYGPKYLNTDIGYKVIQPLTTPAQTDGNFTMGTIIMSSRVANESISRATLPHHFALQMEEGQLAFQVQGYEMVHLLHGDVAFVPAGTPFSYYATVPYTKFMYLNAGGKGLEYELLRRSVPWEFPAYPTYSGFKAHGNGTKVA
ncbi:RmlC-like cupin domain-containing protein [Aspergillus alliaceus]|uniref:RmlC-like cupin domain-containing protein n=1 Tax=Petromyces alliaceus TaxID=209559 RepID=UPI0012A6396E|nr:RmlC-like cupin domain-containing protein [Aspergillus alliaceus]KAB8230404.1 RmlC-like cupin domain-containing protein [Aspergillus alliaceus]